MATSSDYQARIKEMELHLKEMELQVRMRELENEELTRQRDGRLSAYARAGCFIAGVGLVGAGVADALVNPFAFIEAPKLLASGVGLMIVGATGKKAGGKSE